MYKVSLGNKILEAYEGELLSALLMRYGIEHPHPCGGRGTCKKCTVSIDGNGCLSCTYEINSDISVTVPSYVEAECESSAEELSHSYGSDCALALDIGTTTLALALVSLADGSIVRITERTNPQTTYGADVMSRILYCQENGPGALNAQIVNAVNEMINILNPPRDIDLYVSANTTMLHLLLGVDCSSMGVAPYTPTFLEAKELFAKDIGINNVSHLYTLPSNSAFVGADLTAGLCYVGLPKEDKYNLLIDLGTNAEIILYSENGGLCTAAAAGPCFEGANISQGMSAQNGAIRAVKLFDGKLACETVGDTSPVGICGTGLVDAIAELIRLERIDESGLLDEPYEIANGVFITPGDVRQFQLAKSAVYSAIVTLMQILNVDYSNIDKMYITGGFSSKINVENAVYVGLLPRELREQCVPLGNTSLLGTVKTAFEKRHPFPLLENIQYEDLSKNEIFADAFVENMYFL